MSLRAVLRFSLAALLATTLVAPAAAQGPIAPAKADQPRLNVPPIGPLGTAYDFQFPLNTGSSDIKQLFSLSVGLFGGPDSTEVAPMPRLARPHGELRLGLEFGGPQLVQVQYELKIYGKPAVAPMPRQRVVACGQEEIFQVEVANPVVPPHPAVIYRIVPVVPPIPREKPRRDIEFGIEVGNGPLRLSGGNAQWDLVQKPVAAPPVPCTKSDCEIEMALPFGQFPPRPAGGFEFDLLRSQCAPLVPTQIAGDFEFYVEQAIPCRAQTERHYRVTQAVPFGCMYSQCPQPCGLPVQVQRLSPSNAVQYSWHCGPQLPQHALVLSAPQCPHPVPMPRQIVEVIGVDFDCPCPNGAFCFQSAGPTFRAAPLMAPPRPFSPVPANPFTFAATPCDGHCPYSVCLPQPMHAAPAVQAMQIHRVQQGMNISSPMPVTNDNRFSGTWYRDLGEIVVAATFAGDEMKLRISQMSEEGTVHFIVTGDFSVTRSGMIHGVVTGVDVEADLKKKPQGAALADLAGEKAKMAHELTKFVDCPFAFRFKQTSNGMMITNVKIAAEGMNQEDLAIASGMYKFAHDGKVPEAKTAMTRSAGVSDCGNPACRTAVLTSPPEVQVQQVEFAVPTRVPPMLPPCLPGTLVPMMPPPMPPGEIQLPQTARQRMKEYYSGGSRVVGVDTLPAGSTVPGTVVPMMPPPTRLLPPPPANVPPGEFGMMAEVFGQMVGQHSGRCEASPYCAPPVARCPAPALPMNCLQPASGIQATCPVCPVAAAGLPAPSVGYQTLGGTWYRQVGSRMCVVKIAADHLTMSFVEAAEMEGGKVMTAGVSITAEYHLTRDLMTAVGLISNVDVQIEGDLPMDSASDLLEIVAKMQKECEEKPFAMKLHQFGDSLVIGNIRMPECSSPEMQPASIFGGRYTNAANKPIPKLKPMKAAPSAPCALPACGANGTAPRPPFISPPAYGLPTTTPNPASPRGFLKSDSERMHELLYQSYGVTQIKKPWRQFWFQSQPSHLTPERIHGGVL